MIRRENSEFVMYIFAWFLFCGTNLKRMPRVLGEDLWRWQSTNPNGFDCPHETGDVANGIVKNGDSKNGDLKNGDLKNGVVVSGDVTNGDIVKGDAE